MKLALRLVGTLALSLVLLTSALHISNSGHIPAPPKSPGSIRIATHNVHYIILRKADGPWSVGDWKRREGPMDDVFKTIDADIYALQESESFAGGNGGDVNLTLNHLLAENPDYAAAAVGDWRVFPSTQPILYRKNLFRVLDQGWFFFSETPEVIYSRTFNGSYPAFASWAQFAPRGGGRPFYVFNVHFEYKSLSNRTRSAELVQNRIAPLVAAGEPVFLVGDINAGLGSRTARILERAGLVFSPVEGATYHFNRGLNLFGAIDHLAATPQIQLVEPPIVLRDRFRGEWPSDHYPVFADFRLPK